MCFQILQLFVLLIGELQIKPKCTTRLNWGLKTQGQHLLKFLMLWVVEQITDCVPQQVVSLLLWASLEIGRTSHTWILQSGIEPFHRPKPFATASAVPVS